MSWYLNLKTSVKLVSSFLILACILGFVGLYGLSNLGTMNDSLNRLYTDNLVPVSNVSIVKSKVLEMRLIYRDMNMNKDVMSVSQFQARYAQSKSEMEKALDDFRNSWMSDEAKKVFELLPPAWEAHEKLSDQIIELGANGQYDQMLDLINTKAKDSGDELISVIDQNIEATMRDARTELANGAQLFSTSRTATITIIVVAVLLCIVLGIVISQIISRPLSKIVNIVSEVAQGDLRQSANIRTRDEIGQLATSVDQMTDNLRGIVGSITSSSHSVAAAAEQISASTQEIAGSTTNQAGAAQAINEMFAELSSAIRTVVGNTEQASELSEKTMHIAKEGGEVVQSSIDSMQTVSTQVSRLEEDSAKIGGIIEVIEDISDQTNLLALNAAIEAARAGEQGRGFAVVADEVRKLAERSGEATKQIASIIKGMQENTRRSVGAVQQSAELSRKTGEAFHTISEMVNQTGARVGEVAAASEEQSSQANEVLTAVENISAATEEAAASSEETAATAQSLAQLADDLQRAVQTFKL